MHAPYYPMFVSLEGRHCLVLGGGSVGERKIRQLIRCGASVGLVAQQLTPWLQDRCLDGRITLIGGAYEESQLEGVDLVFVATSDMILNRRVASDARNRRLWCNMATDPEWGSFLVPSIVQQGPLVIAVSTSGLSPALARQIREKLEKEFGPEWILFLEVMGRLRTAIQAKGLDTEENQRIFKNLSKLPLPEHIREGQQELALQAVYGVVHPWLNREELSQIWDQVWKSSFSS